MEIISPPSKPENRKKKEPKLSWVLFAAGLVILLLFVAEYIWLKNTTSQPSEAPEVEKVLEAQTVMPFQVLIPAYLPRRINRMGCRSMPANPVQVVNRCCNCSIPYAREI
jgi:hypothetical protein